MRSIDYLSLKAVCKGCANAESEKIKLTDIRVVIPPEILHRILGMGCDEQTNRELIRDCALVIESVIYGLRPTGAQTIDFKKVKVGDRQLCVLVRPLKGKTQQAAMRRGGKTFYFPQKQLLGYGETVRMLITKWHGLRGSSQGVWFDAPGLPACSLDREIKGLARRFNWAPPQGCAVNGYRIRIAAFTQSVYWDGHQ